MCIKTISNFKRTKKRFLKNEKKKVCDVTCEFYSQGYRFSTRLRGIGLRHLSQMCEEFFWEANCSRKIRFSFFTEKLIDQTKIIRTPS